jgi:Ca-activated chloride channel family protein
MSFIWPWMLFSLLLVPVFVVFYMRLQGRRRLYASNLGSLGIVQDSGAKPLGRRRHIPFTLFLLGFTLLLFALSRPQMVLALPQVEGIVMLAFDVSASMAADDLEPTRMEAAKAAAQGFVEGQPNNIKIGVVAFSDGGLVVQTPTEDRVAILETVDRLVPQSGTSLGQGILVALNTLSSASDPAQSGNDDGLAAPTATPVPGGTFAPASIVLLTDGVNTEPPDPLEAAQTSIEQGVRIYTIGIGSTTGTAVEIDGFNIFTQLNEDILKQIAQMTEGEYYKAEDEEDLAAIYENLDPQFTVKPEKIEITSVLAGVSMLVLLLGAMTSLLWFGRIP